MSELLERLLFTPRQRSEARSEATAALTIHGAQALEHLQHRLAKPGRTKDSQRALHLASRIVERHWKRERLSIDKA
jgi:hypothetical protein